MTENAEFLIRATRGKTQSLEHHAATAFLAARTCRRLISENYMITAIRHRSGAEGDLTALLLLLNSVG